MGYTITDVRAIAALMADRDAWQALALRALRVLQAKPSARADVEPWLGNHDAQVEDFERRLLQHVLADTNGNMSQASARLGIGRSTLYDRIDKLGIVVTRPRDVVVEVVVGEAEVAGV